MPKSVSDKRWRGVVAELALTAGVDPNKVGQHCRDKVIVDVRRQAFATLAGLGFTFYAISRVSGFHAPTVSLACDRERLERKLQQNSERNWNYRGQRVAQGPQA